MDGMHTESRGERDGKGQKKMWKKDGEMGRPSQSSEGTVMVPAADGSTLSVISAPQYKGQCTRGSANQK